MNPDPRALPHLLIILSILPFLLCFPASGEDSFRLEFGKGPGMVGFINERSHPEYIGIPLPLGPLSFRLSGKTLWVLDSVQGRLVPLVKGGTAPAVVQAVPGTGSQWLGDFAIEGDSSGACAAFWIIDRLTQEVIQIGPDGKRLKTIGGMADPKNPFSDAQTIEIGPSGRVYVADSGAEKLFILRKDGTLVREIPFKGRGFHLDLKEVLSFLEWAEETGKVTLHREDLEEKLLPSVTLEVKAPCPPELCSILPGGEILLDFFPKAPYEGPRKLVRCKPDGKIAAIVDFEAAKNVIRPFALGPNGEIWGVKGDLDKAPEGFLEYRKIPITAEPEG